MNKNTLWGKKNFFYVLNLSYLFINIFSLELNMNLLVIYLKIVLLFFEGLFKLKQPMPQTVRNYNNSNSFGRYHSSANKKALFFKIGV